jgi:hypothetical protein
MKLIGILLIVIGILMIILKEVNFTTKKEVADLGPVEIKKKEQHTLSWPLYAGIGIAACGVIVLVAGGRKTS